MALGAGQPLRADVLVVEFDERRGSLQLMTLGAAEAGPGLIAQTALEVHPDGTSGQG
jgi:hypothetical protein